MRDCGEESWKLGDLVSEWEEVDEAMLRRVKYVVDNSIYYSSGYDKRMKMARMILKNSGYNVSLKVGSYKKEISYER